MPVALEAFAFNLVVDNQPQPPGLRIDLRIEPTQDVSITIPLTDNWNVVLTAKARFVQDTSALIAPPLNVSFPPPTAGTLTIDASIALNRNPTAGPLLLVGEAGGSRLEATAPTVALAVQGKVNASNGNVEVEPRLEGGIGGGQVVIATKGGDGFLSSLLGDNDFSATFDLSFQLTPSGGLRISGSGGLDITLPLNVTVGPVTLAALHLRATLASSGLDIVVSGSASAKLGPVTAVVDDIGLDADVTFPDGGGNLGPANLDIGFKFPTGIGIFIETSSVSGGGFLFFDQPNGRYGGALELRAYDIDIKAFGLIETKVPGVSFSFVIMISAEFTPIQLGFGITLDGVGGVIGINRTVDSKVLASRVRDGTLDNVLFPTNLIQNAPALINQLATLFPAAPDHHVFGPIAKLGWARIVHGTIGLIFELPSKAISIIGNINAILPKPDNAIVVLDMDIGGKLDFPKKHFELDASLSPNSKVGNYTIAGDMATRIDWGDRPNFAISMGGFHSQFTPPPGFPSLRRMSIALGINGNPSVTLQGFMALTSNTAQIGARLDVYASFGATLTGSVGFEALFVFSPFSFDARMWGNVHVDFLGVGFGMTLDGRIRGPSPGSSTARFASASGSTARASGSTRRSTARPRRCRCRRSIPGSGSGRRGAFRAEGPGPQTRDSRHQQLGGPAAAQRADRRDVRRA